MSKLEMKYASSDKSLVKKTSVKLQAKKFKFGKSYTL